jgi:hypothetical protein
MDLTQRKLNKSEWESTEVPVSPSELEVLNLIISGYADVNIRVNKHNSIFTYLNIEYTEKMEDFLYLRYLSEKVTKLIQTYSIDFIKVDVNPKTKINTADKIRIERNDDENMKTNNVYEFVLLEHIEGILESDHKIKTHDGKKGATVAELHGLFSFHYFTLYKLFKNNILKLNRHLCYIVTTILQKYEDDIDMAVIIEHAVEFVEKNQKLLKYADLVLYEHQKEIFTIVKDKDAKLILYMAPTGTGKTITPIALSEGHRIIFVCAARHVGLALARSAVSANKKIAFAFGCACADDIRLHYFSAKVFKKNRRSGGIGKVDNSVGTEVEIMICDIKSYLSAMFYMLAFNEKEKIITYWDEPTITLDYENHDFHKIIRKNWKENLIPNMVLSSATLPKIHELTETVADFKTKFANAKIHSIVSHDCKKSIPMINKDGFVVLPHYISDNYDEIVKIATHCDNYLTLTRYFDLKEITEFITFVNKNNMSSAKMRLTRFFETIDDINMKNIKVYYIKMLQNILVGSWRTIYNYFKLNRTARIQQNCNIDPKGNKITKVRSIGPGIEASINRNTNGNTNGNSNLLSGNPLTRLTSVQHVSSTNSKMESTSATLSNPGIYVTTKDAFTLTDGPTIFISNDIEKIAKFCIQQANIPAKVMEDISTKIEYNNMLNVKIDMLESQYDQLTEQNDKITAVAGPSSKGGKDKNSKKFNRIVPDEIGNKSEMIKLANEISSLKSMIKTATLNETFVPNKSLHLKKWAEDIDVPNAFTSNVDERFVNDIMLLHGVDDSWKILLMMGIGVFTNHKNIAYTEIMKKMADAQMLYLIIATSDYIYGTNYQFCHGYLSKDLDLTQEKIIQAMGRIGRNNIQQDYTLRFRDDSQIMKLFTSDTEKPEIVNMNRLFNSVNVVWNGVIYKEYPESDEDEEKDQEKDQKKKKEQSGEKDSSESEVEEA